MKSQPVAARKPVVQHYQAPAASISGPAIDSLDSSPVGSMVFWICVVYTFLLCSRTVEFIDTTGRIHLSIITGAICFLGALSTGAIPPMLMSKQGRWLTLFTVWMFIGLPFSMWHGGSVHDFLNLWIKSYITFFIVGGLIFTLGQFRKMAVVLALAGISQIYLAIHGGIQSSDDRLTMSYGSLGNSNDLATALLMSLPYIVFVIFSQRNNIFLRALFVPAAVLLLVAVMKTGSRGGLITTIVLIAVAFVKSSGPNKIKILVVSILIAALFAAVVPSTLRARYMTIFKTSGATTGDVASAIDSSNARREILKNSVLLTIKHPLFGVGLGQFAPQSFNLFISRGIAGMWFTSHDIFGLVSAETGIPGLIFFCGTIVACFRSLWRMSKLAPVNEDVKLIASLANCLTMSLVSYTVCGIFSTQAYTYQLPVLASMTAALVRVAQPHLAAAGLNQTPVIVAPAPFVNRRLAQRPVTAAS
jgi:O-antigen ligase